MLDECIEHLISRRLDGVLSDDESIELDRAVLRSPEVRAALDAAGRIDDLARRALREGRRDPVGAAVIPPQAGGGRLRRWYGPAAAGLLAAAACVMLATGRQTMRPARDADVRAVAHGSRDTGTPAAGSAGLSSAADAAWEARCAEVVNRDVLGVYDEETRSLYLLEIDRSQLVPVSAQASY